jgi:hypothetical protein
MNPAGASVQYSDETALIRAFDTASPAGLTLAIATLVRRAYPAAREECERIAAPLEDHNLRGYVKRAIIEGALLPLPVRFPSVVVRPASNLFGSWHHRELHLGDDWVMTFSHTEHVRDPLPQANFRDNLAARQAGLFEEFDEEQPSPGRLYAVVVHGSPRPTDLAPSFINIVFPRLGGAHGVGINLYDRHPGLRPKLRPGYAIGQPLPELLEVDIPKEGTEGNA